MIGQEEAATAIVERIAMLKAGLNDPGKPIGVFLFAGPTGTGKTELAKTLAEFLFGSIDRMIRLDMSEFQAPDSTWKILGTGDAQGGTESLINRVRKQPFSVVLLDEFEKAHANVWDLFLQVFDDGRLSDTQGAVGDFRHCIIILTTNLGATSHRGSGLGFAPAESGFSGEQIQKAVSQTFRPEFQNRLDKVIVFRPLTRDLMRDILKKELGRVLERRGFKDRDWAVEWEASALEFLLERGFSPEMGARPLKRAIDQYVIAPLAATIVEKRFPQGDQFVFVRSDGRAIQAEFVDPDEDAPHAIERSAPVGSHIQPADLGALVIAPQADPEAIALLGDALARIDDAQSDVAWVERQFGLSSAMATPGFWSRADRFDTLAAIALMDRIKAATGTAHSLRDRLTKARERSGKSSRELAGRLALQLYLIDQGLRDLVEAAPVEVALAIEPTFGRPGERTAAQAWCTDLLGMYRGWAARRNMQLSDQQVDIDGSGRQPALLVTGFGAHRTLMREIGLHVLERPGDDDGPARMAARVRVIAAPLGDVRPERLAGQLAAAFNRQAATGAIVRRYRREPAPLVRDMVQGWRSGRLDAVLAGDFDLIAAGAE